MSDKEQEFTNNFNNYENTRFDFGYDSIFKRKSRCA